MWMGAFVLLVIGVAFGVLVSDRQANRPPSPGAAGNGSKATPTATIAPTLDLTIKVYITGEVLKPGVYQMQPGDRVLDAVRIAGGFSEWADQSRVDQALRVRDEQRIDIPRLPFTPTPLPAQTVGVGTPVAGPPGQNAIPTASDSRINVNTASPAELDRLPGIGAVLSQRLVEYRAKIGPYRSLEDLQKVPGFTKSILEKIKDLITF